MNHPQSSLCNRKREREDTRAFFRFLSSRRSKVSSPIAVDGRFLARLASTVYARINVIRLREMFNLPPADNHTRSAAGLHRETALRAGELHVPM